MTRRRRARRSVDVPAAFAQALRRARPRRRRRAAASARRSPAASPRTSGASTPRAARSASSARWPKLRVAADWRAPVERNRYEARLDARSPRGACPARRRACSARTRRPASLVDGPISPPDEPPAVESSCCATAMPIRRSPRAVGATPRRASTPHRRRAPELAARFPTDAIFYDIRLEPYLLATARAPSRARAGARARWSRRTAATKRALVHGDVSPKNILIGPHGPVLPRCRMRLVRRPGLRPRLLPQPPAAEVPVDARRRAPASSPASTRSPAAISRASTGSRATRSRRARRALLPGLFLARVDGKSPVEYITDEADSDARAARRARRCSPTPVAAPRRRSATAWAKELRRMSDDDRSAPCTAAASGIRAAGRPSRPRSRSPAARAAAPSRRPAPRTGSRRGGRPARRRRALRRPRRARRRSPTSTARSRARCSGMDAHDQAGDRRRADRARRHAEQDAGSAATRSSPSRWRPLMPPPRRAGVPLWRYLGGADAGAACRCREIQIFGGGAHAGAARRHPGLHGRSARRARASPRRSNGPPRSIAPPAR